MKIKKILTVTSVFTLTTLMFTVVLSAPGSETIDWWALGAGGGRISSGNITLDTTIGQAIAGGVSSNGTDLYSGFINGLSGSTIYLPIVVRNGP